MTPSGKNYSFFDLVNEWCPLYGGCILDDGRIASICKHSSEEELEIDASRTLLELIIMEEELIPDIFPNT